MSLIEQFHAGGIFMYGILAFLILTVGFVAERSIALYILHKTPTADFRDKILSFIAKGDFQSALDYIRANETNKTSVGKVAETGLMIRNASGGEEQLQARMDEVLTEEISRVDKRTGFLSMFGNVATLLGLLGTVTGLIASFAGIASATPTERATLLGKGISEALNSTAFGLVAAIPALIAFAVLQNKTDKIINEITETSSKIYHDILFHSEGNTEITEAKKSNTDSTEQTTNA